MKRRVVLAATLLCGSAMAQPVQPPPKESFPVADALAAAPHIDITNGRIAARIAPPDLAKGFYRGTRFDQAGVVTSLILDGREFYGPYFDRTAPEVLDYTYTADGMVAGPDSATSGPVEEFAPLGFPSAPGLFVKIGVGVLRQPDTARYDHYRHYEIVDGGRRETRITRNAVTFVQTLSGGGYSYVYEKTLRLAPGSDRLVIEHRLKNTGTARISTTVYDHNFLHMAPDAGVAVTFPFALTPATPPPADLVRVEGQRLIYLRPFADKERLSLVLTGYGGSPGDDDFRVADAKGNAVHVTGDRPLTRVNTFSINRTVAVEPTIAVDVAPGAQMRWTYTYDYKAAR
jgi:hypothetical protein